MSVIFASNDKKNIVRYCSKLSVISEYFAIDVE